MPVEIQGSPRLGTLAAPPAAARNRTAPPPRREGDSLRLASRPERRAAGAPPGGFLSNVGAGFRQRAVETWRGLADHPLMALGAVGALGGALAAAPLIGITTAAAGAALAWGFGLWGALQVGQGLLRYAGARDAKAAAKAAREVGGGGFDLATVVVPVGVAKGAGALARTSRGAALLEALAGSRVGRTAVAALAAAAGALGRAGAWLGRAWRATGVAESPPARLLARGAAWIAGGRVPLAVNGLFTGKFKTASEIAAAEASARAAAAAARAAQAAARAVEAQLARLAAAGKLTEAEAGALQILAADLSPTGLAALRALEEGKLARPGQLFEALKPEMKAAGLGPLNARLAFQAALRDCPVPVPARVQALMERLAASSEKGAEDARFLADFGGSHGWGVALGSDPMVKGAARAGIAAEELAAARVQGALADAVRVLRGGRAAGYGLPEDLALAERALADPATYARPVEELEKIAEAARELARRPDDAQCAGGLRGLLDGPSPTAPAAIPPAAPTAGAAPNPGVPAAGNASESFAALSTRLAPRLTEAERGLLAKIAADPDAAEMGASYLDLLARGQISKAELWDNLKFDLRRLGVPNPEIAAVRYADLRAAVVARHAMCDAQLAFYDAVIQSGKYPVDSVLLKLDGIVGRGSKSSDALEAVSEATAAKFGVDAPAYLRLRLDAHLHDLVRGAATRLQDGLAPADLAMLRSLRPERLGAADLPVLHELLEKIGWCESKDLDPVRALAARP